MLNALRAKFFEANFVWSMALYTQKKTFSFADQLTAEPVKVFNSKILRTRFHHIHTQADPFIFVWNNELFLFFESMSVREVGCIAVYKTKDLNDFEYLGVILKEAHHLSYPMVFAHGASAFLIPESANAQEVVLYRFRNFPFEPQKVRTLLYGRYFDTSIILRAGIWYFFTSSQRGLEIFFTHDLEHGTLTSHPENPITTDPRYSRCGGQPVTVAGDTFRIAQDCSRKYGGNLNILKIVNLTPVHYHEELVYEGFFSLKEKWNSDGGHQLSLCSFRGNTVMAVDGHHRDYYLNKFLSPVFGLFAKVFS
jgi:hypothetical protein